MIRNIIFDLGNVLISFRPAEYLDTQDYSTKDKTRILNDIFYSREWLQLDNGDITLPEAIDSIAGNSSLSREEIAHIFNLRTDLMIPLHQNADLLPELKKQGFRLYFLSNFPVDMFHEIKSGYYFFNYFDGGVISAEVRFSKPDIRIYKVLLEKYSLIPEETLFIDDLEINVRAAVETGMKGLVTHGSLEISREVKNALSIK
ncbi:MAG TPA: HAD family phosphatase [Bacteroidales bacterium]|nr:HAD family phosphatase [Bacteroidales bacterium]